MKFLDKIKMISDGLDRVMRICTAMLAAGFTILIFATVLSRYVFDFSILFSQEVSKLLFIWSCFLAATVTYKRMAHIRFEFAETFLGKKGVLLTDVLIHSLSLVFFGLIFVQSISYVRQIWETYFPLIGVSQGWLYVSVLISAIVFLFHNTSFLMASLASLDKWNADEPAADRQV
ncbi:MAG: TRAP transporter small permease [Desulfobacterales bacterium]|nr:MAG: TRAP transporter small permease [Desulfobacterales bacterium]